MKKALSIVALSLLIAWASAQASPVFRSADAGNISSGEGTLNVDTEASNVVVYALAAFPCTEALTVTSIAEGGSPLEKQDAGGCLEGMARAELWAEAATTSEGIDIVITLSELANGDGVAFTVSGAHQSSLLADFGISVGQGTSDETVDTPAGDATVLVVFSDSDTITVGTPAGFVSELNVVLASDIRVAIFSDMDSSEATATLSFSAPVEYIVYALGINND